jgi:hypothetical protein
MKTLLLIHTAILTSWPERLSGGETFVGDFFKELGDEV